MAVDRSGEPTQEVEVEREDGAVELDFEMGRTPREKENVDTSVPGNEVVFGVDVSGEWRWRPRHDNRNSIADSGEGYTSKPAPRTESRATKLSALAEGPRRRRRVVWGTDYGRCKYRVVLLPSRSLNFFISVSSLTLLIK